MGPDLVHEVAWVEACIHISVQQPLQHDCLELKLCSNGGQQNAESCRDSLTN